MILRYYLLVLFCLSCIGSITAQIPDSLHQRTLDAVIVPGYRFPFHSVKQLDDVHQTYITSGKKNEVIHIEHLPANLAEKTGRQVFARVPGAFIYDMDGSGNQVNFSTRGLDPHRSWEYNIRQNGVMTNSDVYAYPASHYSPPMEAIQRIEHIRGTASLQYGAQFGGMINYVTKQPDTTRTFGFESLTSAGSFGLMSSFNAIGGKIRRLTYYGYYQRRVSDGYRRYARSDAQAQYGQLGYAFSPSLHLTAAVGRSQYLYQIPGALTDAMFRSDPRQNTRSRNYFSPDIYVPSLTVDWAIRPTTRIQWVTSAILGHRSSVQFIGFATVADTINALTGQYNPRQVDIDRYNSYTTELRLQQDYRLGHMNHTLVAGIRYINNHLYRRQLGKGTTGTDYDLTLTDPDFGRDIRLKTGNVALFLENLFRITKQLSLSAGARLEQGESRMTGRIAYLPDDRIPQQIDHKFPLFGVSVQYVPNAFMEVYGGWSQAYRPVLFSDLIPGNNLERTDPDMKDAFGYNSEIGLRGAVFNRLSYDLSAFQIDYRHRVGTQVLTDENGQAYVWRTNIGDSKTRGVELSIDLQMMEGQMYKVSMFSASSYFDGRYVKGRLRSGSDNVDLKDNALESVPRWISRNGLQIAYRTFTSILQYSYVAESFGDPLNTVLPTANGGAGIVPAYSLWDWNMSYRVREHIMVRFGINNLTNKQYFTKRPTGYPGPGVWSSDGRSIVVSVGIKM